MGRYIGIVGRNSSGKDTLAAILERQGFHHQSLSDTIRSEATLRGIKHDRNNLIALGNQLRVEEGPGVLAARVVEKVKNGNWVFSSIRHPREVEVLKSLPGFELWRITSSVEARHAREVNRQRDKPMSLEEYRKIDAREDQTSGDAVQRIGDVEAMADITIVNEGTIEELKIAVKALL